MVTPAEIKPEVASIDKGMRPNWNFNESVKKVQGLYISWKTISEDMLEELWTAKMAITDGGKRKAGMVKSGQESWSAYIKECFGDNGGPSKRSIDSYLKQYCENGFSKPEKLTVSPISDHTKLVIRSAVRTEDGRVKLDIYLPEHDRSYIQYING